MKVLVIALFAAVLRGQEPAGAIEGRLRDSTSRAPVGGARVTLRGPSTSRVASSALDGGFRFDQLAPGDYMLAIQTPGYVDSTKGLAPKTVSLKPGAVTENVVIDLAPLGAMEGTILGDDNKPLGGASVRVAGEAHTTLEDGRFAFADIAPGSYQVAVNVPHTVRSGSLVRDNATGDFYGYAAAQFYPGTDDVRLALPVDIAAGSHLRNVDLRLRRTLLVEFTGRLVEMAGREAVTDGEVELIGAVSGVSDSLWRKHATGADGKFRFSLLQPGAYKLAIYRGSPLPYMVPIELGKAGADELAVPIPPFARIPGIVRMSDPKVKWQGSASIRLRQSSGTASVNARLKPDDSFELEGVPPGEYIVDMLSQSLRLVSDGSHKLFAKELRFGAQTGLRKPITVVESGNPPIEIELSDGAAGLTGKVVESDARSGQYLVSVMSVEKLSGILSMSMTSAPDFQFPELAPGEYQVTAWRYASGQRSIGPRLNESCDETVKVTVRDGAVSTITLRPCK